jgi:type I restriction enzyme, S subunit
MSCGPGYGELPWPVPRSWAWVRLDEIALPQAGFAFKSDQFNQSGVGNPLIRIRDIGNRTTECHYAGDFRHEFLVEPGNYLVGMDGNFNIRRWAGPTGLLNQRVARLIFFGDEIERPFIAWALQDRINALHGSRAYTTVQHLSGKQIGGAVIPLPPQPEQERIVARVNELKALCDDLETRQERRRLATIRVRGSVLHALTEADTPDDLRRAWERVWTNWPALTGDPEAMTGLHENIVQLVVEGWLAPQELDDEPAAALLRAYERRRLQMVASGSLRSRSELGRVSEAELPYRLPIGWALARLDEWCDISGGIAKGRKLAGRATTHLPYLRVANVKAGYLALDEVKEIEVPVDEVDAYSLRAGDVLLTEGGDWDKLGRSAIWTGEIDPCLHQNHIFRARTLDTGVSPEWISIFTNSKAGRSYFQSKAKRTTNLASINMTELRSMPLPVPPRAEQRRILTRLAELTDGLSTLAHALRGRDVTQRMLADGLAAAI